MKFFINKHHRIFRIYYFAIFSNIVLQICSIQSLSAQIRCRFLSPDKASQFGIKPLPNSLRNILHKKLYFNEEKEFQKQDSLDALQNMPYRFGKDIDVDIDFIKEASTYSQKDTTFFIYSISLPKAKSINLIFDKFKLSSNASLLIYSKNETMIFGPVTEANNPINEVFWTDIIKGDEIIIKMSVIGPLSKNIVHISKIIYGYNDLYSGGFGQSSSCNKDIACSEGNNWRNEANSVSMIILANGTRACSGALVNNTCQNLIPYYLTANHCLDGNESNWIFRFRYESSTCGGGDGMDFITYNGSIVRASSPDSDFALLELNTRPGVPGISYAGWTKQNIASSSGTSISHPRGDVKKIATYNSQITQSTFLNSSDWKVYWSSGTVEPGSSGAPLFNNNKLIIGQVHGGITSNICTTNDHAFFGRFDISWSGNGTNSSRLSNWLDPNNSGLTSTGTIGVPYISGSNAVCSQSQFSLINLPTGSTIISWSISPASIATVNASSGLVTRVGNGIANLNVAITSNGCVTNVTKQLRIGAAVKPTSVNFFKAGNTCYYNAVSNTVSNATSYIWSGNAPAGPSTTTIPTYFTERNGGSITINVKTNNECGQSAIYTRTTNLTPLSGNCLFRVGIEDSIQTNLIENQEMENAEIEIYPNPSIANSIYFKNLKESESYHLAITDVLGKQIFTRSISNDLNEIDISALALGFYFVTIEGNGASKTIRYFKQ